MYYKRTFRRPFKNYTASPRFVTPMLAGLSNDDCLVWLQTYSGQDVFISSLKDQLINKAGLTTIQWKMADKNYRNSLPKVQLPQMNLSTSIPIMVNRTVAFKEIRDKYKIQYGVFALKITSIANAGVARNGNRWAEVDVIADADSPVSACRVCGKTLKDHASILTGIGSVCAKKYFSAQYNTYKKNPAAFMAPFKAEVAKLGTMRIKLWQNQVNENVKAFMDAVDKFMGQTPATPAAPVAPIKNTPIVAPPKPPTVNEIYWDANAEPWKMNADGNYVWEMNSKMYDSLLKNLEFVGGSRFILRVTNILTQNVVDFVTPIVSFKTDTISMIGYHNGKGISLHIKCKA